VTTPNPNLQALWDTYRELAAHPAVDLTHDERAGVVYFLADSGQDDEPDGYVARWIDRIRAVESFRAADGRLPRADSHRPRADTEEQSLVDVLSYFRQVGIAGGYCTYQRQRLETIPGFSWRPRADAWHDTLTAHQQFWAEEGRAPRRRSPESDEVRLGRWVAQQRTLYREGRLEPARETALRSARYRVL
jgi:hypothetical protein